MQPNGDHFASVGADSKLLLYGGAEGNYLASLSSQDKQGHKGSIFALSWSKDSKFISTSGGDRTIKVRIIATTTVLRLLIAILDLGCRTAVCSTDVVDGRGSRSSASRQCVVT
jgi:WD40 repeat protein